MIEHLPHALSSLNAALSLGSAALEIKSASDAKDKIREINNLVIEAQQKVIASQTDQAALAARVDELKEECMRLKNWEAERSTYARKEIAAGVFAYINNSIVSELKSAHKFCCNCFDNHKKSTLQQFHIKEGRLIGLSCHNGCPDLVFRCYL